MNKGCCSLCNEKKKLSSVSIMGTYEADSSVDPEETELVICNKCIIVVKKLDELGLFYVTINQVEGK